MKHMHIHFMGICGTAMASLAGLLKNQGHYITGSDENPYPPMSTELEKMGIEIQKGYKKENLEPKPDLVIVGNVISRHFEEAQALLASDIPYKSLPEAVGEFIIQDRESMVVCGTHGKTTTTSMMAWAADQAGLKAGFLIGGIPKNFGRSFQLPQDNYFIIEGDEYDTAFFAKVPKFVYYKPKFVILTSVEFDHADIYNSIEDVKKAFLKLTEVMDPNGVLVYCNEDPLTCEVAQSYSGKKVSYGFKDADYILKNHTHEAQSSRWDLQTLSGETLQIRVPFLGKHNALNATAVIALSQALNLPQASVIQALASFKGVKRRLDLIGCPNDIQVYEDFAHHPTSVAETVKAVKSANPNRKLLCIFEPRSATSRRKVFQQDYAKAFKNCNALWVAQAYNQNKIAENDRFSSEQLVDDLNATGTEAHFCATVDDIVNQVSQEARPGDIVLIMSNGGFDGLYTKLLEQLK